MAWHGEFISLNMYTKQIKSDDKIFYLSLKSNHNCNLLKVKKY